MATLYGMCNLAATVSKKCFVKILYDEYDCLYFIYLSGQEGTSKMSRTNQVNC
jgi:hypothetical protein